jgi:hypothetical protein
MGILDIDVMFRVQFEFGISSWMARDNINTENEELLMMSSKESPTPLLLLYYRSSRVENSLTCMSVASPSRRPHSDFLMPAMVKINFLNLHNQQWRHSHSGPEKNEDYHQYNPEVRLMESRWVLSSGVSSTTFLPWDVPESNKVITGGGLGLSTHPNANPMQSTTTQRTPTVQLPSGKTSHETDTTVHHSPPPPNHRPSLRAPRPSQLDTRYMNMLLALDSIPRLHNLMAAFFTWILLAGFVLLPGTFTSLQRDDELNETEAQVLNAVKHVPLWVY